MSKLLETNNEHVHAYQQDLACSILKMLMKNTVFQSHGQQEKQKVPAWAPFNAKLRKDDIQREDVIGYCKRLKKVLQSSLLFIPFFRKVWL